MNAILKAFCLPARKKRIVAISGVAAVVLIGLSAWFIYESPQRRYQRDKNAYEYELRELDLCMPEYRQKFMELGPDKALASNAGQRYDRQRNDVIVAENRLAESAAGIGMIHTKERVDRIASLLREAREKVEDNSLHHSIAPMAGKLALP